MRTLRNTLLLVLVGIAIWLVPKAQMALEPVPVPVDPVVQTTVTASPPGPSAAAKQSVPAPEPMIQVHQAAKGMGIKKFLDRQQVGLDKLRAELIRAH